LCTFVLGRLPRAAQSLTLVVPELRRLSEAWLQKGDALGKEEEEEVSPEGPTR